MPAPDPDLARREACASLLVWAVATVYAAGACAVTAYRDDPGPPAFVLGFPSWVFWGVLVPWCGCTLVTGFFAVVLMKDEPLGEDRYEAAEGGVP